MLRFRDLNVASKILIPIIVSFGIIIGTMFYYVLPKVYDAIYEKKKEGLHNIVELAYTVLSGLDKDVSKGLITQDEAQASARNIIKYMRFEKKNYYFVFDHEKMLIQPVSPERENKPLSFFKDDKKNEYLVAGAKVCESNGEGFIIYHKAKPKTDIPLPKLSFVREFKSWGWIIGAGVYFDDIEKEYILIRDSILLVFVIMLVALMVLIFINTRRFILSPIKIIRSEAEKISNGDFSESAIYDSKDELGMLLLEFNKMKHTINNLIEETNKTSKITAEGRLDYRSDSSKYAGAYKALLLGLNNTMDAIIHPLNVAAEYIDRISKGDMPPKISDDYKGDFNEIKNNINQCIDAINHLIHDSKQIFTNAIDGNINSRADVSKHHGEFRNIILGVNSTLDRLVGLIDGMPIAVQIVDKDQNVIYANKKRQLM